MTLSHQYLPFSCNKMWNIWIESHFRSDSCTIPNSFTDFCAVQSRSLQYITLKVALCSKCSWKRVWVRFKRAEHWWGWQDVWRHTESVISIDPLQSAHSAHSAWPDKKKLLRGLLYYPWSMQTYLCLWGKSYEIVFIRKLQVSLSQVFDCGT